MDPATLNGTAADLSRELDRLSHEVAELRSLLEAALPHLAAPPPVRQLVTLHQMAAMVHRSKHTLDHYRHGRPAPVVTGGGGRPSLWDWTQARPWLEGIFGLRLPERFPGSWWPSAEGKGR